MWRGHRCAFLPAEVDLDGLERGTEGGDPVGHFAPIDATSDEKITNEPEGRDDVRIVQIQETVEVMADSGDRSGLDKATNEPEAIGLIGGRVDWIGSSESGMVQLSCGSGNTSERRRKFTPTRSAARQEETNGRDGRDGEIEGVRARAPLSSWSAMNLGRWMKRLCRDMGGAVGVRHPPWEDVDPGKFLCANVWQT